MCAKGLGIGLSLFFLETRMRYDRMRTYCTSVEFAQGCRDHFYVADAFSKSNRKAAHAETTKMFSGKSGRERGSLPKIYCGVRLL